MNKAILPLPQHVFMAWCLVKHRDNFLIAFLGDGPTSTIGAFLMFPEKAEYLYPYLRFFHGNYRK
jgi:hypothetical protein